MHRAQLRIEVVVTEVESLGAKRAGAFEDLLQTDTVGELAGIAGAGWPLVMVRRKYDRGHHAESGFELSGSAADHQGRILAPQYQPQQQQPSQD